MDSRQKLTRSRPCPARRAILSPARAWRPRSFEHSREITRFAAELWNLERSYLADPRRVLQVRDTALVVSGCAVNVVRRGDDGSWRYSISLLDP